MLQSLLSLFIFCSVAVASPILSTGDAVLAERAETLSERASSSACPRYTLINTRGTGELQGPSAGFRTMNQRIQSQLSGGQVYNTVYAASFSQISTLGTIDIVNQITNTLRTDPGHCFILEGYSQGASATVEALKRLSGAQADAVKGVFLIGNPQHKAGLACNVDANGGTTTRNVNGLSVYLGGVPATWVPKTLDVCNFGDGVCDTLHGAGINAQHLVYSYSSSVQDQGTTFALKQLGAV